MIRFPEEAEPATPPTGKGVLYIDAADGKISFKDDTGTVSKFLSTITSVNGQTGVVMLNTDDIAEGAINLYHTSERVDDRVATLIQDGGGITKSYNDAGNSLTLNTSFATQYLNIVDEKPAGTKGGTFTFGAWRTRDLNTARTALITGASLALNQITLPAGTYRTKWVAPAHGVKNHQTRLYDTTGAATLIVGASSHADEDPIGVSAQSISSGDGEFALFVQSVLELQHQCDQTIANDGFGRKANFGEVEIFSQIEIWKVG